MAAPMGLILLAASVASFSSFAWGARWHFRRDGAMPAGMKVIAAASAAGFAFFVWGRWQNGWGGAPQVAPDTAALAIMTGSTVIFWWAVGATRAKRFALAFSKDHPVSLQETGPYTYVRHPFYLSYIGFWTATGIASTDSWHWTVPAGMAVLYLRAIRSEEAAFAASCLRAEYEAYRSRTGMLFPIPHCRRMGAAE